MDESRPMRALVTGAAGGMGRATCIELLQEARRRGCRLRIAAAGSRAGAALVTLVAELQAAGAEASAHVADLADPDACARLGAEAIVRCEGLDALYSVAGMLQPAPLATLTLDGWQRVFDVDVRATWLLAQAAYPALKASRGCMVAVASVSAIHPFPGLGAYSPAKAALVMLCRQLAQEWAGDGIRVNSVSPGLVRTPLTESVYADEDLRQRREAVVPLQRIGSAADVARALVRLASPDFSYVTGIDLRLDGGLCDRVLATVPGRPPARAPDTAP